MKDIIHTQEKPRIQTSLLQKNNSSPKVHTIRLILTNLAFKKLEKFIANKMITAGPDVVNNNSSDMFAKYILNSIDSQKDSVLISGCLLGDD